MLFTSILNNLDLEGFRPKVGFKFVKKYSWEEFKLVVKKNFIFSHYFTDYTARTTCNYPVHLTGDEKGRRVALSSMFTNQEISCNTTLNIMETRAKDRYVISKQDLSEPILED